MSDYPPCDTCGAVSDDFKEPLREDTLAYAQAFRCSECGSITPLDS